METDRRLSEYMQDKNVRAYRASRVIAFQFLILAVFFCAYMLLQNSSHMNVSLGTLRRIVLTVVGVLELYTTIWGTAVAISETAGDSSFDSAVDEAGIRQSREVVSFAYENAKGALIYKITLAIAVCLAGFLSLIIAITVTNGAEAGTLTGKVILWMAMAAASLIFWPSYDRLKVYKAILSGEVLRKSSTKAQSVLLSLMGPLTIYIYLLWIYFGNKRTIAWIVFAVAGLLYLAVLALIEYVNGKTRTD